MQRLALALTSYQATTFLLGEYGEGEHDSAVFTVADGLLWLYQAIDRNSVVRKLQVIKMRGQGQIPGLHTARITDAGYSVFPRILKPEEIVTEPSPQASPQDRRARPRQADGRRHPDGIFGAGRRSFGLRQDRALESVHRRGHQSWRERDRRRLREATQRLPADHAARGRVREAGPTEEAGSPLPAPAGSLDRRDLAGASGCREADRRETSGDRFAVRSGAGARADLPGRLPRIALPNDGGADGPRRHGDGDGRAGRLLRGSPIQPPGHRVSRRTPSSSSATSRSTGDCGARWRWSRCAPASTARSCESTTSPRTGDRRGPDAQGVRGPSHGDSARIGRGRRQRRRSRR